MERWHVPGLALAVVSGDEVLHLAGYGQRDPTHDLPVTPETLFPIASIMTESYAEAAAAEKKAKEELLAGRIPEAQPAHPLDAYAGEYYHPGYGHLSIRLKLTFVANALGCIGSLSIPLEETVAEIVFVRQAETGAKICR